MCHTALLFIVRGDPAVHGDAEPVSDAWTRSFVVSTGIFALAVVVACVRPGFGYYVLLLLALQPLFTRRRPAARPA